MKLMHILFFPIAMLMFGCNDNSNKLNDNNITKSTPNIGFIYVKSFQHDTTAFTEGFFVNNGKLYESTGAPSELPHTKSLFGIVDTITGKIDTKVEIDKIKYFGEGIAFLNGKIYQLTYKTKIGFVYDASTFKKVKEFTFPSNEGWGLTTDGTSLIMSDGTDVLTYLNPITFELVKKVKVTENGYATDYLNELEYIKGYIFANVWTTNTIVKINPTDGKIVGKLNLTPLHEESKSIFRGSMEMNGIAYDSIKNRIFITGKLWPKIFELKFYGI